MRSPPPPFGAGVSSWLSPPAAGPCPALELGGILDPRRHGLAYAPTIGLHGQDGQIAQMAVALGAVMGARMRRIVVRTGRHPGRHGAGGCGAGAAVAVLVDVKAVLPGRQARQIGHELGRPSAARDRTGPIG